MAAGDESETPSAASAGRTGVDLEHPVLPADQRLLIRACTAPPDQLRDAVDEWLRTSAVDDVDHAGSQLLSLLYRRLVDNDVEQGVADQIAASYRMSWANTQMLAFRARPLVAKLGELGSRPVLLKGGAMQSSAYYDDLGVRPVVDLDFLVDLRSHRWPKVPDPSDNERGDDQDSIPKLGDSD